jgi:hypothetical protein
MYSSLKEQINFLSNPAPLQDANENFDASELLKEKVGSPTIYCDFEY